MPHRSKHHHAHSEKLRKKYPRWHRRKKRPPRVRKKKRKSFLKRLDDAIMTKLGYDAPPGFRRLYMQPYRPPPRG